MYPIYCCDHLDAFFLKNMGPFHIFSISVFSEQDISQLKTFIFLLFFTKDGQKKDASAVAVHFLNVSDGRALDVD